MENLQLKKEAAKVQAFIDDVFSRFISEIESLEVKVDHLKKENQRLQSELYQKAKGDDSRL
jgi:hypothetical protein